MYLYVQMVQRTLKEDVQHEFVQPAQPKTTNIRVATLVLSGFLKLLSFHQTKILIKEVMDIKD